MIDRIKVGNYLKKLRLEKKDVVGKSFSLNQIADEFVNYGINVTINAIKEWEKGKSLPSLDKLEILSKIYNRSINEILEGEDINKINFNDKYFIVNKDWMNKYDKNDLYLKRNEQIFLIVSNFKYLIKRIIKKSLTSNEENELEFLFNNFYSCSSYIEKYTVFRTNNSYLKFKDALNKLLFAIKDYNEEYKYWEVQKLYHQKKQLNFTFWNDLYDAKKVMILNKRLKELENWQKDELLAMFQNIDPYVTSDGKNSKFIKNYELENNTMYDIDKIKKDLIKYLIDNGACLNSFFLNYKKIDFKKERIIDRLVNYYNICLKPIEININLNNENKTFLIENNKKNRFLKYYYFPLKDQLFSSFEINYVDELYNWFVNTDEINEDTYRIIANRHNIETNREIRLWMSDVKSFIGNIVNESFYAFKAKEKEIEEKLIEMEELESLLKKAHNEIEVKKEVIVGGKSEDEIRDYIEHIKYDLDYKDYLKTRNKKLTKELMDNIDGLTFNEIKEKYLKIEILENKNE